MYANREKYVGTFVNWLRETEGDAKGTYYYDDGAKKYEGPWKANKMEGAKGTYYYTNGNIFMGKFVNDEPNDAAGTMKFFVAEGKYDVFVGKVAGESIEEGTYTFDNGDIYIGKFVDGVREDDEAIMKLFVSEGQYNVFEGKIADGNFVSGKYTNVEGDIYTGKFVGGMPNDTNGKLEIFVSEGEYDVFEGKVVNGAIGASGKYTWASGNVYDGEWSGGVRSGKGTMTYVVDCLYYDGEWADDKKSGDGKLYKYNDESEEYDILCYDGEWASDQQTGSGTKYFDNGDYYVGELVNGLRHGKGTYYYAASGTNTGLVDWENDAQV